MLRWRARLHPPSIRPATMLENHEKWPSLDGRRQGKHSTSTATLVMDDRNRCSLPPPVSASAYLDILSIKIAGA